MPRRLWLRLFPVAHPRQEAYFGEAEDLAKRFRGSQRVADGEDPLDAFMAEIDSEIDSEIAKSASGGGFSRWREALG